MGRSHLRKTVCAVDLVWWNTHVTRWINRCVAAENLEKNSMKQRLLYFIPLLILAATLLFFRYGLGHDPHFIPSTLIQKPAPAFNLPTWQTQTPITEKILLGKTSIVHVFATWCDNCQAELPLLRIIADYPGVNLYGIAYKDNPESLAHWLAPRNPYQKIGLDTQGIMGIDWGVYGTPETYIVDARGIICYKHIGVLTEKVWENELKPFFTKH